MKQFVIWVTALTSAYQEGFIAGLVKKGYMVGPAAKNGQITAPGNTASALIALNVYKIIEKKSKESEPTAASIHIDVMSIFNEMKAYYYSVIVSEISDCCWIGSNFDITNQSKIDPPTPKKDTMN